MHHKIKNYNRMYGVDYLSLIKSILEPDSNGHKHSILVGKKCAYCMDCGQILLEYSDKKILIQLMNPNIKYEEIDD